MWAVPIITCSTPRINDFRIISRCVDCEYCYESKLQMTPFQHQNDPFSTVRCAAINMTRRVSEQLGAFHACICYRE